MSWRLDSYLHHYLYPQHRHHKHRRHHHHHLWVNLEILGEPGCIVSRQGERLRGDLQIMNQHESVWQGKYIFFRCFAKVKLSTLASSGSIGCQFELPVQSPGGTRLSAVSGENTGFHKNKAIDRNWDIKKCTWRWCRALGFGATLLRPIFRTRFSSCPDDIFSK